MDFVRLLGDNLGALFLSFLALGAVLCFVYAGWQYQTAFGDQQKMAKGRNAFFAGVIGVLIGGFAFVIPGVFSEEVIEPSGGTALLPVASSDCDSRLRDRLVSEIGRGTAEQMNYMVAVIQGKDRDGCGPEVWNPVIGDDVHTSEGGVTRRNADYRLSCFAGRIEGTANLVTLHSAGVRPFGVGAVGLPGSFIYDAAGGVYAQDVPRPVSSRDRSNNLLIYFGQLLDTGNRPKTVMDSRTDKLSGTLGYPHDRSRCWLFLARDGVWLRN